MREENNPIKEDEKTNQITDNDIQNQIRNLNKEADLLAASVKQQETQITGLQQMMENDRKMTMANIKNLNSFVKLNQEHRESLQKTISVCQNTLDSMTRRISDQEADLRSFEFMQHEVDSVGGLRSLQESIENLQTFQQRFDSWNKKNTSNDRKENDL